MVNYILRRLMISIQLLLGVAKVSFIIIQLPPGDFATTYQTFLITNGGLTQDEAEAAALAPSGRVGDLRDHVRHERLSAEPRFDRHDQQQVDVLEEVVDEFPDYGIEVSVIGDDFRQKLVTTFTGGSGIPSITGVKSAVFVNF